MNVSCFSCKSRKARQEKERQEAEEKKSSTAIAPSLELKIEVPKSKPIDTALFQGLDSNVIIRTDIPPDQTTEVITITRVSPGVKLDVEPEVKVEEATQAEESVKPEEAAKSDEEKKAEEEGKPDESLTVSPEIAVEVVSDAKKSSIVSYDEQALEPASPTEQEFKQTAGEVDVDATMNIELKTVTPSMIGSTSLEAVTKEEKPTEHEHIVIAQPSDDIVKLPEPKDVQIKDVDINVAAVAPQVEVKAADEVKVAVSEPAKSAEKKEADKKDKKHKTKSKSKKPVSCFSTKKNKAAAKVDKEKAPTVKSAEVKHSDAKPVDLTDKPTYQVILPPSDWAIGLDRADHVAVVRKDPEVSESKAVEASLTKSVSFKPKIEKETTIEMPSVIDLPVVAAEPKRVVFEESLSKPPVQLTIDSPGAYVKLDREPDHAVIPILVSAEPAVKGEKEAEPVPSTSTEAKASDHTSPSKTAAKKAKKEAKAKKTSPLDMPLIDLLTLKSAKTQDESKKKHKKEKKSKAKSSNATAQVCRLFQTFLPYFQRIANKKDIPKS